jgi:hypothetical protein
MIYFSVVHFDATALLFHYHLVGKRDIDDEDKRIYVRCLFIADPKETGKQAPFLTHGENFADAQAVDDLGERIDMKNMHSHLMRRKNN